MREEPKSLGAEMIEGVTFNRCMWCGTAFVPDKWHPNQRYCDRSCKKRAETSRHKKRVKAIRDATPIPSKKCAGCGKEFVPSKGHPKQEYCKERCWKKAWYEKNKDSLLESQRRYRESHLDQVLAANRAWRERNRARILAAGAVRYERDRDRILAAGAARYANNKGRWRVARHLRHLRANVDEWDMMVAGKMMKAFNPKGPPA